MAVFDVEAFGSEVFDALIARGGRFYQRTGCGFDVWRTREQPDHVLVVYVAETRHLPITAVGQALAPYERRLVEAGYRVEYATQDGHVVGLKVRMRGGV